MQIVIDIPDEEYEIIKKSNAPMSWAEHLIKNGTPLPKGHGKLIDADILEKEIVNGIKAGNYEEGYESYAHINSIDDVVECVKYADTIIEADTESAADGDS